MMVSDGLCMAFHDRAHNESNAAELESRRICEDF